MKDPLIRRLPRELKSEAGKYIVIFIFMVIVIGFVSGFLVASGSLVKAYDDSFEKYNIEDGNFELLSEADNELIDKLESKGITLYENLYKERETDDIDSSLRIFLLRDEINKVCVNDGELPGAADEIAIDRMYADNNSIKTGDTLSVGGRTLTVTGLVALSDYSALYADPSDMMFEAIKFGVAVMTEDGFNSFDDSGLHWSYSWKYDNAPADDIEAKEMSEELLEHITARAPVVQFIPMYANNAIQFVGDDTGHDRVFFAAFLYIVIVIIAFIMAITTSNTIAREATVIGTLRASGYTRGELIRHYLTLPTAVTAVSAVIGNILGYTLFKEVAMGIYYTNYSLPLFDIVWNADAFVQTTVIPVILMFLINLFILSGKMKLSPLQFIRRDLKKGQKKKAFRLNTKIPIMHRFRLRIIFQNIPNYITIVVGVFLANVILLLGMGFPKLLDNTQQLISDSMVATYQYVLKAPAQTENADAEKYCAGSLVTIESKRRMSESVTIYGTEPDSRYIEKGEGVYVSEAYSSKFGVEAGDTITLKEEFGMTEYSFEVAGIYNAPTTLAVYMDMAIFNETFGNDADYFNGYLSDEKLEDIDKMLIATIITEDDMNKMSRQLGGSMSAIFDMFFIFGLVMFMLIVYLLSKIIIEKNSRSISMTKILGYTNSEISGLYIISTAIVVVASFVLTMPLVDVIMEIVCGEIFAAYPGWLPYAIPSSVYVTIIVLGIAAYAVIALLQYGKVKRIPLDEALKNIE